MSRVSRLMFVVWLPLALAGAALAAERPVVREVVVSAVGNGARIEIRADQPLTYSSYLMPELAKWVIDLPGATSSYPEDEAKKLRTPPLERITVRQKDVNGEQFTRIGLDFTGEVDFSIKPDPVDQGRLVAALTPSATTPQQRLPVAAPPSPSVAPAATTGIRPPAPPPPATATAARTITAVTVGVDTIRIEADGRLALPTPLILGKPGRLVLDLVGVSSSLARVVLPTNRFGIVRSRLGKSGNKLRLVFEVSGDTFPEFRVKEILHGLEIVAAPEGEQKHGPGRWAN